MVTDRRQVPAGGRAMTGLPNGGIDPDTLDLATPCLMCGRPIREGDEPGSAQSPGGDFYPVCSVACTRAFFDGWAEGATMTVGEMLAALGRFDPAMPVTVMRPDGAWWFNIDGVSDPSETGEPSVILFTRDDFDTRQF